MANELLAERREDVLLLTMNRPEAHNALNKTLVKALWEAFDAASNHPQLRAVILTGVGEKSFCSGADLKESASDVFKTEDGANPIADVFRAIENCNKPVIARINGSVLAGGMGLVAACDLAFAADHARFGLPEVRVGVFPMMVAAKLMLQIPQRRLQSLAYLGESISAIEAEHYGLIDHAVPAGELDTILDDIVAILLRNSPLALAEGKMALRDMRNMPQVDALKFAERKIAELGQSEDASEGRLAFAEKRKPRWAP